MSQITLRGQGGPMPLQANGTFQQGTQTTGTPGAYGTSITYEELQTLTGTRWDLNDGREVILVSTSSATTTEAGNLYQDSPIVSGHQGLVVTAFSAYGTSGGVANSSSNPSTVTVTLGGAAATANEYQGGYVVVASSTGIGQTLRIASHPAQTSTTGSLTITLEDAPNVALTTSSTVNLIPPHGANVVVSPTTPTNASVGVALYAINPSSFGYLVSKGIVGAVSDASPAGVGEPISPSKTTAGTVTLTVAATTTVTTAVIGSAVQGGTSAEAGAVYLNL